MLDLMIGNSEAAFSLGEVYAWFRPWRSHHFSIDCSCGKNPCPKWEKIRDLKEQEFHGKTMDLLGINILVDSSKEQTWIIDNNQWGNIADLNVKNILIYKKIKPYLYSNWKRNMSFPKAMKAFVNYYKRFFRSGLNYVAVDHAELVKNPESCLRSLCGYTGIEYQKGQEHFWKKQHHHLFGSYGTRLQLSSPRSQIRSFEEYPVAFEIAYQKYIEKNGDAAYYQFIFDKLRKHDFKHGIEGGRNNIRKSGWYYFTKMKSWIRGKKPHKWHMSQ